MYGFIMTRDLYARPAVMVMYRWVFSYNFIHYGIIAVKVLSKLQIDRGAAFIFFAGPAEISVINILVAFGPLPDIVFQLLIFFEFFNGSSAFEPDFFIAPVFVSCVNQRVSGSTALTETKINTFVAPVIAKHQTGDV